MRASRRKEVFASMLQNKRLAPGHELTARAGRHFGLADQLVDGGVERLVPGRTRILMTNHPLVIDQVQGRPAADVPLLRDGTSGTLLPVPEGPPGDLLFLQDRFEG